VEEGKEYRIEAGTDRWTAGRLSESDFGREVPVQFDGLIKLNGIDVVICGRHLFSAGGGESYPVAGVQGRRPHGYCLPAVQRNCLNALKQAGKKIVFINCSGSAIGLVAETESCDAILQAWYAGESGGRAITDVIFRDYSPSGAPITFYRSTQQLPDFENYSMKGRTYRFMSDPLFPFGFGLSYTAFSIGRAALSKTVIRQDESVQLTIPVTNTGRRDGTEVVQVYVRKVNDTDGPLKTLRGFQRVSVPAGETGQVRIDLPPSTFEFFDRASGKMAVTAGEYEMWYGNSSDTRDLKQTRIMVQ
jgi:beta-glucosidase